MLDPTRVDKDLWSSPPPEGLGRPPTTGSGRVVPRHRDVYRRKSGRGFCNPREKWILSPNLGRRFYTSQKVGENDLISTDLEACRPEGHKVLSLTTTEGAAVSSSDEKGFTP